MAFIAFRASADLTWAFNAHTDTHGTWCDDHGKGSKRGGLAYHLRPSHLRPSLAYEHAPCMTTWWLDGSTEAHSRITFEVITFEPLRVVRADFTGFQWQHGAAHHEELIALSKA